MVNRMREMKKGRRWGQVSLDFVDGKPVKLKILVEEKPQQ